MRSADNELTPSGGQSTMPSVVNGVNGVAQGYDYPETTTDGPYRVLDQYHSKPRRLRVACVGAGASGLCLAYKMNKMLEPGSWELTLFDKNKQFGGTCESSSSIFSLRAYQYPRAREYVSRRCLRYSEPQLHVYMGPEPRLVAFLRVRPGDPAVF